MNLALARVVDAPGGLRLEFGESSLEIPESQLSARPALRSYAGRSVALRVRSEDMEDASLASNVPDVRRIKGKVNLTEALGSEIVVHFTFSGQPVVTDDTKLIAEETGEGELHIAADEGVKWVASFAPRSRVRMGDEIEIALDVERAHFFDPETSEAIRT